MLFSQLYDAYKNWNFSASYDLSDHVEQMLEPAQPHLAADLTLDQSEQTIKFNQDYNPRGGGEVESVEPKFRASFPLEVKEGISVEDSVNQMSIKLIPKFKVQAPIKQTNRVVYPLIGLDGAQVITLNATGIKEDIVLNQPAGDKLEFSFELDLPDGLEARLEPDGSLGVYGVDSVFLGNVSTGNEADAELLERVRKDSAKTQLLFRSPAPFVLARGGETNGARAWYGLSGDILTIYAAGLAKASYPISIDPSIYVETAAKLMRGNNETNIDFDVSNELIQKGATTGARFDSWVSTLTLPAARWNHATAVAGGYIYAIGGSSGSTNQSTVYWARLNQTTGAIESANPGAGACSDWCNVAAYDLPAARAGHSLVAYNGFLYVLGGFDGSGTRTSTVYIAKLGANGEPSLWHPTDTNKSNWVYWYSSASTLSTERTYSAASAYNNRLYLFGGQTNAATGGVTTVELSDLRPTGDIGSWSSTGLVALPSARHNHAIQVYNDRVYLIGGNSSGTLQNSVHYIKLATDGTMVGSWTATTTFSGARMAWGGNFSAVWGGFLYISAGCTAINGSGYCTTIANDTQIASINADGTLTDWQSIAATSSRIGYGLSVWRGVIYGIGGCTAHNTSNGNCTTTVTTTQYGDILQDGEASTIRNSVASGTSPCVSTTWTNCNMPPLGNGNGEGGQLAGGAIINNGFIYYLGGCYSVGNNSVCFTGNAGKASDTISFSAIAADGTLVRGSTCPGTYYGSWCVDNSNTLNGSDGLAAFGYTVFNNVIYVVGGTDGTTWQSTVWRNPLNADGTLGSWSTQTFTNLDLGAYKGYPYVFARANPSSAGTFPGNLYVIGGCGGLTSADNGLDCNGTLYTTVYKCNITTSGALEENDSNDCTTTNQVQIDSEPGTGGNQGLGVMAGTVYANYVYLIGGQSDNEAERGQVMYAKIDNSNNIVDVDGETSTDNIWETSSNEIDPVRRRSSAFGYNGYLYTLAGYNVSEGGSLNDLLFAKIDVSDGSIDPFVQSTVTVNARWDLRSIVNNGYVYTFGGCSTGSPPANCTATTAVIQTFQLFNNYSGSPYSYGAGANLFTTDRIGASSAILNGFIYIAGGCTSSTDCTTATDNVQFASLSSTGAIGSWANTNDSTLPAVRTWGQLEAAGGTLYYIGGQDSTDTNEQSTVYYGTPNVSTGDVSSWNTASNGLPAARTKHSAAVWNDRIYITGGLDGSAAVSATVYVSPQLSSGGDIGSAWSSSTAFNVARSGHATVAYANNLYVFGGHDGSNYLSDSQYTQINSDGTVDSWSYTTSLPTRLRQAEGFAANGFMYLIGGRSADTTCESNTIVAPISANTTVASGNNPTGVGEWYETNIKYTGDRYGAAAVYNEGKVYLLGGGCGATITYTGANRVVQSTLQAQPQVAKYSRMIDTDTDVFPNSWLMNGLDNDIGARWLMRYRSSTSATASWGQETNYGTVTLGDVDIYAPLDGGGSNTNFARYYYFYVTIDSSRAYGYPDDVTRGPTVADISLFFTSDPSKRLRHGKTFTGGEKQPLDTPCRQSVDADCPLP